MRLVAQLTPATVSNTTIPRVHTCLTSRDSHRWMVVLWTSLCLFFHSNETSFYLSSSKILHRKCAVSRHKPNLKPIHMPRSLLKRLLKCSTSLSRKLNKNITFRFRIPFCRVELEWESKLQALSPSRLYVLHLKVTTLLRKATTAKLTNQL